MKKISIGDPVPNFTFNCTDPNLHSFADLLGSNIVLYFYPKDNTPGCTLEGRDFKILHPSFLECNTRVLGVSRDNLLCHEKFSTKLGLPFALITDPDEKLCQYFNVVIENNIILRFLMGIERTTFFIDDQGIIRHIWKKIRAKGHAQQVLDTVKKILQK
ncbi:peroxiredoxin [Candidatus Berkiella cookevillensis]|uniref:thioredoxin-dependent peroxiredoxin n=1 Tax=Candidatus Berkiella cookevillensis TaxID=437022 RepID=A0A0Q9YBD6_9GAMM|nr:peroxiredoxin [Candidatus Berkiella cookevillensis]MCS5709098.1 peroxiredoxin [Candidatus Berkiella cookevillensis]